MSKKYLAIVAAVAVIALGVLGFVIFGGGGSIVGEWEIAEIGGVSRAEQAEFEAWLADGVNTILYFSADGSGSMTEVEDRWRDSWPFEWSVNGNRLTIIDEWGHQDVIDFRVSGSRLTMYDFYGSDVNVIFRRVR